MRRHGDHTKPISPALFERRAKPSTYEGSPISRKSRRRRTAAVQVDRHGGFREAGTAVAARGDGWAQCTYESGAPRAVKGRAHSLHLFEARHRLTELANSLYDGYVSPL